MERTRLMPLALLYTRSRASIDGSTRFQKLVFLSQEEVEHMPSEYAYRADRFGPFSPQLSSDLDFLIANGLIECNKVTNEIGHTKDVYAITGKGIRYVQKWLKYEKYQPLFDVMEQIKTEYAAQPLNNLLKYVYSTYPTYIIESDLDIERLFDPDSESQFLDPPEIEYVGTEPGEWKELNSSADEIFSL